MRNEISSAELIFTEYSIGLTTTEIIAPLLTPNFLRYNEIVPESLGIVPPVILGADSTSIEFANGLEIRAANAEVSFAHVPEEPSAPDVESCIDAASRFTAIMAHLDYDSVTADVQGYMMIPAGCPGITNIGPSLDGILPVIYHHAVYPLPNREINFYAYEVNRRSAKEIDCLDLRSVTSYPASANQGLRRDTLLSILATWEEQLTEFIEIATSFYHKHVR